MLNRIYPLRKCQTYNKKPCLYYHINQCLGYCTYDIKEEVLNQMKNNIIKFLNGDYSLVINKLKQEMQEESLKMHYEKALELKELLEYITITLEKQKLKSTIRMRLIYLDFMKIKDIYQYKYFYKRF